MKQRVCVLGEGAWGTAVASLLADNGHMVSLWCHDALVAHSIAQHRCNQRYMPDVELSDTIIPTTDIRTAVADAHWIFEAIPVKFLRSVVEQVKPHIGMQHHWVVFSKGIEVESLMFPSTIIDTILGYTATKAVVSGPSFARDLINRRMTCATIATTDAAWNTHLIALLANTYFRPTLSEDVMGAQIGGALKNVVALIMGMLDAQGYTDNTKTYILMRGLHEMKCVTRVLGGRTHTMYGPSGLGDLVLTCMGALSKNVAAGKLLGAGHPLDELAACMGTLPEGINTAISVNQLAHRLKLPLPLLQGAYRIIFEHYSLHAVLDDLAAQPLEDEALFC